MTPERLKELRALCDAATGSNWDESVVPRGALQEALDEIERLREALRIAMRRWFDESTSDVYDPDAYEEVDAMLDGHHEWSGDDWKRCKAALLGLPPASSR